MPCVRFVIMLWLVAASVVGTAGVVQAALAQDNDVVIRGEKQQFYHYAPTGTRLNKAVLFVPGVRGWAGWAITIARALASSGYDVYGLDTKVYLDGFTRAGGLTETDVMNDFRLLGELVARRSGAPVTLIGWSEGAGLGVLAAADRRNPSAFDGLVAFGLSDENAIAWHWADNLMSLVTKPNEPTFKASDYIARIAPLPFFLIQSSHDQEPPVDEAKRLFGLAREPKSFVLVEARNHRFDGNQEEFLRTLRDGLQWVAQTGKQLPQLD